MDAIHASGVVGWIEQPNVSLVHVQAGEPAIGGALSQDLACVGAPLNSDNWRVSEDAVGKQSATAAGEQMASSHSVIRAQDRRQHKAKPDTDRQHQPRDCEINHCQTPINSLT